MLILVGVHMYTTCTFVCSLTNVCYVHCVCLSQGLFRKVCLREISATDLVRMKSEQYASDELAEWREKTLKKVQQRVHCTYMYMCTVYKCTCTLP